MIKIIYIGFVLIAFLIFTISLDLLKIDSTLIRIAVSLEDSNMAAQAQTKLLQDQLNKQK